MKLLSDLSILLAFSISCNNADGEVHNGSYEKETLSAIRRKDPEAKRFCEGRNLNTDFYIHIDLRRHSGLKRFFIWDFAGDSISHSFLVSQGCCQNSWGTDLSREKAATSNTEDSHCSSIGKYVIGERGYSSWGFMWNTYFTAWRVPTVLPWDGISSCTPGKGSVTRKYTPTALLKDGGVGLYPITPCGWSIRS